ncbi:hypothetical protein BC826DRAFT_1067064 [Russula brevipes]|nr:hypothetical protein BC826DRAFT_1067064 [Russula brevipes]
MGGPFSYFPQPFTFRVFTFGQPISAMPIHRHTLGVRTKRGSVAGCLWQRAPRRNVIHAFDADIPMRARVFSMPTLAPPEVFDTLIQVHGHTLLVSGYFDERLEKNPNLKRDFPFIPWRGEIAVLFVGKRKHFLNRGPPGSIIHLAITQYMGACLARAELSAPFPTRMRIDGFDFSGEHEHICGRCGAY